MDKSFLIQQVAIHILDSPYPIAIITLGEEFLDFQNYTNDPNHLAEIKEECENMIKELKKRKLSPDSEKFILTPSYTEDNGLLTPTKKTKFQRFCKLMEK